jgi:hypothetical protein
LQPKHGRLVGIKLFRLEVDGSWARAASALKSGVRFSQPDHGRRIGVRLVQFWHRFPPAELGSNFAAESRAAHWYQVGSILRRFPPAEFGSILAAQSRPVHHSSAGSRARNGAQSFPLERHHFYRVKPSDAVMDHSGISVRNPRTRSGSRALVLGNIMISDWGHSSWIILLGDMMLGHSQIFAQNGTTPFLPRRINGYRSGPIPDFGAKPDTIPAGATPCFSHQID